MLLAYLQGDRPIRTKVSVRPVEEPEADHQARHTGDERAVAQRVLSERERRRHDPDQRDEESHPGENQEAGLQRSFVARGDLDTSTSAAVRRANGDHHHCTCEHQRLRDPRIHGQAPFSVAPPTPTSAVNGSISTIRATCDHALRLTNAIACAVRHAARRQGVSPSGSRNHGLSSSASYPSRRASVGSTRTARRAGPAADSRPMVMMKMAAAGRIPGMCHPPSTSMFSLR